MLSTSGPQYKMIIKHPIDLTMIKSKIEDGAYHSKERFLADVSLMVLVCSTCLYVARLECL